MTASKPSRLPYSSSNSVFIFFRSREITLRPATSRATENYRTMVGRRSRRLSQQHRREMSLQRSCNSISECGCVEREHRAPTTLRRNRQINTHDAVFIKADTTGPFDLGSDHGHRR